MLLEGPSHEVAVVDRRLVGAVEPEDPQPEGETLEHGVGEEATRT